MIFYSFFQPIQTSFWPLLISLSLFSLLSNFVMFMHINLSFLPFCSFPFFFVTLLAFLWWNDLSREAMLGYHTHNIEISLRFSVMLFILSEVFFFLSFFWAFYDASLSPTVELGLAWPPNGIIPLSPYSVPLLNTIILLSSGISVTWCHHSIVNNYFLNSVVSLGVTVSLGVYFLAMQWLEYNEAQFSIADGVFGSTFFMATGFHGFHVFIGTSFLFYVLLNLVDCKLLHNHHFSFEAAAWYWHFVDVVWLFLFVSIYWWGSL